jgi:hypothetical protein
MRLDLKWWRDFLPSFNRQTQLIPCPPVLYNDLATDPSSSYGYGAFVMGGFVSLSFTHAAALFPDAKGPSEPIHIHESFAILMMCRLYSAALSGRHVRIFVDNTVAVAVINKGSTAQGLPGPRMMEFIRELFWLSAIHNFRLTAQSTLNLTFLLTHFLEVILTPSAPILIDGNVVTTLSTTDG